MLNKNGLFRGGLYLVNTAVVAIFTSGAVVAEGIEDFRNQLNQIWWRIKANNLIKHAENRINQASITNDKGYISRVTNKNWIANKKYRKSIIEVIGKAIGDCVTGKNEFNNKGEDDIITFGIDKFKDLKKLKQKHWNAIYLYNYIKDNKVEEYKRYFNTSSRYDLISFDFERLQNKLYEKYYKDKDKDGILWGCISKARKDIEQYACELNLQYLLHQFFFAAKKYDAKDTYEGRKMAFDDNSHEAFLNKWDLECLEKWLKDRNDKYFKPGSRLDKNVYDYQSKIPGIMDRIKQNLDVCNDTNKKYTDARYTVFYKPGDKQQLMFGKTTEEEKELILNGALDQDLETSKKAYYQCLTDSELMDISSIIRANGEEYMDSYDNAYRRARKEYFYSHNNLAPELYVSPYKSRKAGGYVSALNFGITLKSDNPSNDYDIYLKLDNNKLSLDYITYEYDYAYEKKYGMDNTISFLKKKEKIINEHQAPEYQYVKTLLSGLVS